MKKSTFITRLTTLFAAVCCSASALAAVPESFSTTNNLPPPAGTYISPALWHVLFANGIVIRDVSHHRFTDNTPPPPLGATQVHTFNSTVNFQLSTDNGLNFSPASGNAIVKVRVKHTHDTGGKSFFQTEMLALDLTSGTLMLRESPTLPSKGKTTIRAVAGGHMISSFFDIFTEISTDGGATWTPGQQAAHVEYRNDPANVPPVPTPTPLLPPPGDVYVSPQQWHALYAQGIVIKDVKHKYFTPSQPPPPPGTRQVHQFDSHLDMQLSTDGGINFQFVSVPATVQVAVENKGSSSSGYYDTEMLALSFTAPGGVMIRESPTLPSRGGTRIDAAADGSFRIGSFFDIFTELSLNGGGTWSPATSGPVRVVLEDAATPQPAPTPNLPVVPNGEYVSPQQWHALYANGIIISNVSHNRFTQSQPPPPPGATEVHTFNSFVDLDLVQPGQPPVHVNAPAQVTVSLTSTTDSGNTRYFDTEMLQLDILMPGGIMVRESPSRPSRGRTSIRQLPGGGYQVDSFFDIFTEISLNGVAGPWSEMVGEPGSVRLRVPTPTPINIVCPGDMTVPATGAAGAVVNFVVTASGGCDTPTVVSTPPSGSLFPVGTTTVTSVATDSCGNQITCTFNVTVQPPLVPSRDYFFPQPVLPPPGVYISPAQYHILTAAGVVIRDVRHRRFTKTEPVPPLGGTRIHTFDSTVDFEVSTSGPGGPFQPASGSAKVTVQVTHTHDQGSRQFFDTEMLALDLTSSALRLRESPTLRSRGQTSLRQVSGGYMIDSFFDIFTEFSLDGGMNWTPAPEPAHVELRPDPTKVPGIPTPSNLLPPPNDAYVSPAEWHALFAQGIVIKDVRHKLFTQSLPAPPAGGPPQTHSFNSVLDMEFSQNGGATFQSVRITPVQTQVEVDGVGSESSSFFDTEMLALNAVLPGGALLRESPTMPSRGVTTIEPLADGTYMVDSFFDIFTEISVDGGMTWDPPTNGPVRVQLKQQSPEQQSSVPILPPPDQEYISPQEWHVLYANGIIISNVIHDKFVGGQSPPPPGQSINHSFDSSVSLMISLDGGQNFSPATANASVLTRVTSTVDASATMRYFETEMLGMQLSGGTLPPNVVIRESPTRASLGRTSMRLGGPNDFRIGSFFDVFTEISLNGGANWSPAVSGPATVRLRNPIVPPVSILCPSDMTVAATSSAGAVVNFILATGGGCDAPILPTVTSTPPSGSVFPVGTTTVTCVAKDSCGNTATCTFNVTVKPYIKKRFFAQALLPPPNGQYVSPADWHALYASGIIISNASHQRFLGSIPPPPPGPPVEHTFDSQVNFDVSLGAGQPFQHVNGTATTKVRVTNLGGGTSEQSFDTEMLQLDLTGPGGPNGIMIRESPTLASRGEVHIAPAPGGGFMIDSFFDIFTEISLNGGMDWSPATSPVRVELQIDPGAASTILTKPRRVNGKPTFSVDTRMGLLYLMECKGDLLDPEWFTISGAQGTGTQSDSTDYLGDDGKPRYYRAKVEEPPDPEE